MPFGRVYVPPPTRTYSNNVSAIAASWNSNQSYASADAVSDQQKNGETKSEFRTIPIKIEVDVKPVEEVLDATSDAQAIIIPPPPPPPPFSTQAPSSKVVKIPVRQNSPINHNGSNAIDYNGNKNGVCDVSGAINGAEDFQSENDEVPRNNGLPARYKENNARQPLITSPKEEEEEEDDSIVDGPSSRKSWNGLPSAAKGLKNLGNTCYMNSIIQCLVHTRKLLEFSTDFLATTHDIPNGDVSRDGDALRRHAKRITKSLARLTQEMWKSSASNHGVADPSGFRNAVCSFAPKFSGFEQHDSQEFLLYALDGLHTELNRVEKKDSGGEDPKVTYADIEDPSISAEEKSRRCLLFYLSKDDSVITDLFLGQLRSTLKCTECRHESVTFEPFLVVSVPLSKDTHDVQECMELFVKADTLEGDEMPLCERCKERRQCTKWYSFERWPQILVLHLKRFGPSGSFRSKLSTMIEAPLKHLDLSPFSSNASGSTERPVYECFGVSNHSGTLHGGHYTAACRHPYNSEAWHMYNDRSVSGMSADRVITSEAYLMFFHRTMPRTTQ